MWWWLACAQPTETTPVDPDAVLVPLDGPRLLRRMSLDLRGTLPSVAELDAAEIADEEGLDALRDALLEDPAFEERVVLKLAERWHTRVDEFLLSNAEYLSEGVGAPEQIYAWERAVGEEPLRLMAWVAANDRPWTEIVTADYTVANETLAAAWPIDYPEDGEGWEVSTYTDGRPAAGVLATNGLWWRYYSTVSNYNRGRAAAISRLLLCEDYLARPVTFDSQVALVDEAGVESALRSNPYCLGCHSSLDPLASALFGFWVANEYSAIEMDTYHRERELLGQYLLGTEASFFGTPVAGLAQLGEQIAQDPRFSRCAAETFAEVLWGRAVTQDDFDRVELLRDAFLAGDGSIKPLLRAVVDTPVYRAGALEDAATDAQRAGENTTRLIDAILFRSVMADLSGFSWQYEGFDQLDNDTYGYRLLGGGVDGSYVTGTQRLPSITWLLTNQLVAEGAASQLVEGLDTPEAEGRIFTAVSSANTPDDAAFQAELAQLHWRLFAVRADDGWLAEMSAIWREVEATDGPDAAWTVALAAMLQDPLFVTY